MWSTQESHPFSLPREILHNLGSQLQGMKCLPLEVEAGGRQASVDSCFCWGLFRMRDFIKAPWAGMCPSPPCIGRFIGTCECCGPDHTLQPWGARQSFHCCGVICLGFKTRRDSVYSFIIKLIRVLYEIQIQIFKRRKSLSIP